jgi:hypothetical protein
MPLDYRALPALQGEESACFYIWRARPHALHGDQGLGWRGASSVLPALVRALG